MPIRVVAVFIIAGLFSSAVAWAQSQPAAPDNKKVIQRLSKELGLDEAQKSKVEAILNDERKQVEAVFAEERKKLMKIQEQTRASLEAVLTPAQMKKMDQKMHESAKGSKDSKKQ